MLGLQSLLQLLAEGGDRLLLGALVDLLSAVALAALVRVQQTRDATVKATDLLRSRDGAHSAIEPRGRLREAGIEPLDDASGHRSERDAGARRQSSRIQ